MQRTTCFCWDPGEPHTDTKSPRTPHQNTTAVDPRYLELVTIHDRDFQKFSVEHSVHLVPVDEAGHLGRSWTNILIGRKGEAERLENQHWVFSLMFDQRLIFASMARVRNVLDCGYGTASWAIEVAEAYPDCEVRPSASCSAQHH